LNKGNPVVEFNNPGVKNEASVETSDLLINLDAKMTFKL